MISKKSNYSILFGLNSESGYLLLNKENDVVDKLQHDQVIYDCEEYKWLIKQQRCTTSLLPKYSIIKIDKDDNIITSISLPNRQTILLGINNRTKAKNPFMFYPKGSNILERFLIKNDIYNASKIIKYDANNVGKKVPFEIFWRNTDTEHYPYAINIYTKDKRILKEIIKELSK